MGRPSLAPGRYFRLLLVGCVEGLDSERAIAWRAADSLSLRSFLRVAPPAAPPDHSTISRTGRLLRVEVHEAVFTWVLQQLAGGPVLLVFSLISILVDDRLTSVYRPVQENRVRFRRTHLAHTAEQAVDLETGAVVGRDGARGGHRRHDDAGRDADRGGRAGRGGAAGRVGHRGTGRRQGIPQQPDGGGLAGPGIALLPLGAGPGPRRCLKGRQAARDAVYANRRRIRGARGRRLLRCRGELLERPFAHLFETGGMWRVHLRGHPNILKRLLVHVAGCNLGLLLRHLIGVGTPRSLQGRAVARFRALIRRWRDLWGLSGRFWTPFLPTSPRTASSPRHQTFRPST